MDNTETTLRALIAKIGEIDANFSADADLRDELGFDSYLGVEYSFEIERVFKIRIPLERVEELKTLNRAVGLVTSLLSSAK